MWRRSFSRRNLLWAERDFKLLPKQSSNIKVQSWSTFRGNPQSALDEIIMKLLGYWSFSMTTGQAFAEEEDHVIRLKAPREAGWSTLSCDCCVNIWKRINWVDQRAYSQPCDTLYLWYYLRECQVKIIKIRKDKIRRAFIDPLWEKFKFTQQHNGR